MGSVRVFISSMLCAAALPRAHPMSCDLLKRDRVSPSSARYPSHVTPITVVSFQARVFFQSLNRHTQRREQHKTGLMCTLQLCHITHILRTLYKKDKNIAPSDRMKPCSIALPGSLFMLTPCADKPMPIQLKTKQNSNFTSCLPE